MRTKLFGAFIAALAITAFAALPSAASAANVTLKEGNTTVAVNETVRATSTNFTFQGRTSGLTVACAKASIRAKVRTNPGARLTFRDGGVFEGPGGGDKCPVAGTGGRISFRESVTFREDITLKKTGTAVEGRTTARFTFRFFDQGIEEAVAVCGYEGSLKFTNTVGTDNFHVESEEDAELESSVGGCDEKVFFRGDFRLTRRDGKTEVKTN